MATIYLDESGDLGWKFDSQYQRGGSSRYLTLAAVVVPDGLDHHLGRVVRGFYKKRKRSCRNELKSVELSRDERTVYARKLIELGCRFPELRFLSITVRKERVNQQFRDHPNGLYNYMAKLLLIDEFAKHDHVSFMPDERSVRIELRHAMDDYLRTELAIRNAKTRLTTTPLSSKNSLELQFCDIFAGIVWSRHEFCGSEHYLTIEKRIQAKTLFFS